MTKSKNTVLTSSNEFYSIEMVKVSEIDALSGVKLESIETHQEYDNIYAGLTSIFEMVRDNHFDLTGSDFGDFDTEFDTREFKKCVGLTLKDDRFEFEGYTTVTWWVNDTKHTQKLLVKGFMTYYVD